MRYICLKEWDIFKNYNKIYDRLFFIHSGEKSCKQLWRWTEKNSFFSCTSGEVQRKLHMQLFLSKLLMFCYQKVYQQTVRRVPEKYMHLHILYAYQYLEWSVSHVIKGGTSKSNFSIKTKFMYSAVEILRTHLSTSSFKHFKHIPSTHTVLCACSFLMPTFLKGLMNHCAN